jgi:hypothetical protein
MYPSSKPTAWNGLSYPQFAGFNRRKYYPLHHLSVYWKTKDEIIAKNKRTGPIGANGSGRLQYPDNRDSFAHCYHCFLFNRSYPCHGYNFATRVGYTNIFAAGIGHARICASHNFAALSLTISYAHPPVNHHPYTRTHPNSYRYRHPFAHPRTCAKGTISSRCHSGY